MATKGNPPAWGGSYGILHWTIYNNTDKRGVMYRVVNFSRRLTKGYANLPLRVQELDNLAKALADVKKWLRDK